MGCLRDLPYPHYGDLVFLGLYLGRIAKENVWMYGTLAVVVGLIVLTIVLFLGEAKSQITPIGMSRQIGEQ